MVTSATSANLSPLLFLERSASVYPDKAACIYNGGVTTYSQFYERVRRHAAALQSVGVQAGDRVAYLVPNCPLCSRQTSPPWASARCWSRSHTLVSPGDRLHPQPLRRQGAGVRFRTGRYGASTALRLPRRRNLRSGAGYRAPGRRHPESGIRSMAGQCRAPAIIARHNLRNRHPHHQLHLRHHRHAQGRGIHSQGRIPQRPGRGHGDGHELAQHLPLDAAHVSRQRLVLPLGSNRRGRNPRVPAPRGPSRSVSLDS